MVGFVAAQSALRKLEISGNDRERQESAPCIASRVTPMKTSLALLALPFLATSTLIAQEGPKEGQELLDLFERMHRDGATEADLRKMLGDKTLLDLEVPEAAEKQTGPVEDVRKLEIPKKSDRRIGLILDPVPQVVRDHFALGRGEGMRVFQVMNGSPAHRLGLQVNDIVISAGDKKIGSVEDLRAVVERAGEEDEPLKLTWIHRGDRKSGKLRPEGQRQQGERDEEDGEESERRAMMRRIEAMARRMEVQQREIEVLRGEIERLKRESKADE
ncbi:MAG: PDZ domain-containing protein [Verrucomicrobiaceae bacterium]|nr:MAG: PDZ domain-containing protein [Verrucomicrobiaceae bacterium]